MKPNMQLLIATQNPHKRTEFQALLDGIPYELVLPADIDLRDFDVEETGSTLAENATLKARAFAQASGLLSLADDSGLFVDALNGEPGIYSKRYGGPGLDDSGRRRRLLEALQDVPDAERTARFEAVIAVSDPMAATPQGELIMVHGICPGKIIYEDRGTGGFGYDPLFIPDGYDQTFAEMDPALKDRASHRGLAAAQILPLLIARAQQG
jgi:XTP/dITP diphosphohydrolase